MIIAWRANKGLFILVFMLWIIGYPILLIRYWQQSKKSLFVVLGGAGCFVLALALLAATNPNRVQSSATEDYLDNHSKQVTTLDCFELKLSSNTGAHEEQLIRRCNNPYFSLSRQVITEEELKEARNNDNDDYSLVESRLNQLISETESMPPTVSLEVVDEIRTRLDDIISFAKGSGRKASEIALMADELRETFISKWRTANATSEEMSRALAEAETAHQQYADRFYIPVIAQLIREKSPILSDEAVATVMSGDDEELAIFMRILPEDARAPVRLEGLKMLEMGVDSGYVDPQFEQKVIILENRTPPTRD